MLLLLSGIQLGARCTAEPATRRRRAGAGYWRGEGLGEGEEEGDSARGAHTFHDGETHLVIAIDDDPRVTTASSCDE